MKLPCLQGFSCPVDCLFHELRRVERGSRFEDDPYLVACLVKCSNAIGLGLVLATVVCILFALAEEVAVQLLDMILRKSDFLPRLEDELHRLGVSSHFLLIPCFEGLDFKVGQQPFNFAVGKLASFNPCGGSDTLDGGNSPQSGKTVRRQGSQSPPRTLEFIELRDEVKYLWRDLECGCLDHDTQSYTQLHPFPRPAGSPIVTHFGFGNGFERTLRLCHTR